MQAIFNKIFHFIQTKIGNYEIFIFFVKIQELFTKERKLKEISEELDYLKIDIQGGELDVFRNGRSKLAQTVLIQTEVSFIPLYEDQPTFSDIDIELRAQGFIPHFFPALKNWMISPLVINNDPRIPLNQLIEADIVYVKDFTKPENISDEQLKHLALISHACYKSFDLSMRCIAILEQRGAIPVGSMNQYPSMISQG